MSAEKRDATGILLALEDEQIDPREAMDKLYPIVYAELRRLAGGLMRSQREDHTLQPTALVHEAFLKMVRHEGAGWQNRAHFFRVAGQAMRQILVNYARDRAAAKRGGDRQRVTLDENLTAGEGHWLEVLALDEALTRLAEKDERMAKIVELRAFAGMKVSEIAHVLEVSPRTVDNYWKTAKMFLLDELADE